MGKKHKNRQSLPQTPQTPGQPNQTPNQRKQQTPSGKSSHRQSHQFSSNYSPFGQRQQQQTPFGQFGSSQRQTQTPSSSQLLLGQRQTTAEKLQADFDAWSSNVRQQYQTPSSQAFPNQTPQHSTPSFTPSGQLIMGQTPQQENPHFSSPFFLYNYESKTKNIHITNPIPDELQAQTSKPILVETKTTINPMTPVEAKTYTNNPIHIDKESKENSIDYKEKKIVSFSTHIRWGMANEIKDPAVKDENIDNQVEKKQLQTSITKSDKEINELSEGIDAMMDIDKPEPQAKKLAEESNLLEISISNNETDTQVQKVEESLTELETSEKRVDGLNAEATDFSSSDGSTPDKKNKEFKKNKRNFKYKNRKERRAKFVSTSQDNGKMKNETKTDSEILSSEKKESGVEQFQIVSQLENLKIVNYDPLFDEKKPDDNNRIVNYDLSSDGEKPDDNEKIVNCYPSSDEDKPDDNKKSLKKGGIQAKSPCSSEENLVESKNQDLLSHKIDKSIRVEENIESISDSSVSTIKSDDGGENSQTCSFSDQKVALETTLQDCDNTSENKIPPSTQSPADSEYYGDISFQTPRVKTSRRSFMNNISKEPRRISSGSQITSVSVAKAVKFFDMEIESVDDQNQTPVPSRTQIARTPVTTQTPNWIQDPNSVQTPTLIRDPSSSSVKTPNLIQNPSPVQAPGLIQNHPTPNLTQNLSSVQTPIVIQNPEIPMKTPIVVIQNNESSISTETPMKTHVIQNPETPMKSSITPRYNLRTRTPSSANVSMNSVPRQTKSMRILSLHAIEEKIPTTPSKSTQITELSKSTTIDDSASTSYNSNNLQTSINKNEFSTPSTVKHATTLSRTPKPWPLEIEILREELESEFRRRNITQKELANEICATIKTLPGSESVTFSQSSCSSFLRGVSKPRSTLVFDAMRKWIDSQTRN
ncbi:9529_t:CDS:2 [Ambispora gerdemannii]|uniref:9529_t:CDS:1 n=1 Tax=Ambispora gerdemannii TaxID=144530 RepID=A0A9N8ZAY7_9GLOM|nr:9529_t:CDS:2 [Ambispora gerdemannii]